MNTDAHALGAPGRALAMRVAEGPEHMSRFKKLQSRTAILASCLVVFGHSPALAQATYNRGANESVAERARPGYDPLGLRFGGFDVRAGLDLQVEQTDNVFAEETGAESDTIYFVRPTIGIASHWSRHSLSADASADSITHQEFDSEDRVNTQFGVEGRLDVRRTTQIGGSLRAADLTESRTDPDAPELSAEPVEFTANSARAYVQHQFNRVRVSAAVSQTTYDYEDTTDNLGAVIDQDSRDRDERFVTLRSELGISPRIALLAEATFDKHEYDVTAPMVPWNRNSEGSTYLVGANFDLTRLIRGEVAVGYLQHEWEDPSLGETENVALNTNIDWFPTELTTVNFRASRRVDDSGTDFAASYLHSEAGVRVDHELLRNLIITGGFAETRREYRGLVREDEVVSADLGLRYLMNRRVVLSGGYRYEDQTSTGANRDRDFEINRFFLSLGLRV